LLLRVQEQSSKPRTTARPSVARGLWALIPLLSAGRIRSSLYLIGGEVSGFLFFGLGHAFSTNFFSSPIDYSQVPNFLAAASFLAGGVVFVLFDVLAVRQLSREIRSESAGSPLVKTASANLA
jgi:hypothetical protein